MVSFCLDGSALAKRYLPENGSALVDFVLDNVAEQRIYLLNVGYVEVVSVLVRKKNAGMLSVASDQRLVRAAQAERLVTFNPEIQDQAALAVLMGS